MMTLITTHPRQQRKRRNVRALRILFVVLLLLQCFSLNVSAQEEENEIDRQPKQQQPKGMRPRRGLSNLQQQFHKLGQQQPVQHQPKGMRPGGYHNRRRLKGQRGRASRRGRRRRRRNNNNNRGVNGGGQDGAFGGGLPVRCIVRGEPVLVASVPRRRPNVSVTQRDRRGDRNGSGDLQVGGTNQRGGRNNFGGGGFVNGRGGRGRGGNRRQLQEDDQFLDDDDDDDDGVVVPGGGAIIATVARQRQPNDVYWPSVQSEEDCFFGVFAIEGNAARGPPLAPSGPTPTTPAPSISSRPSVPITTFGPVATLVAPTTTPTISSAPTMSSAPSTSKQPSMQPSISNAPSKKGTTIAPTTGTAAAADVTVAPGGRSGGLPEALSGTGLTGTSLPQTQQAGLRSGIPTIKRNVGITLDFGFFFESLVQEPTPEEIAGLEAKIDEFYKDLVRSSPMFGLAFSDVTITNTKSTFDATKIATKEDQQVFPVSVTLDMEVSFMDVSHLVDEKTPAMTAPGKGLMLVPTNDQLIMILESADYAMFIEHYAWEAEPQQLFWETQMVQFTGVAADETIKKR